MMSLKDILGSIMGSLRTRFLSIIFLISILTSIHLGIWANNPIKASLVLSDDKLLGGQVFEVSLYLENTKSLSVLELTIPIDPNVFSYVDGSLDVKFDYGDGLITKGYRESRGDIYFSYVDTTSPKLLKDFIFSFKLKVKEGTFKASGQIPILDLVLADPDIEILLGLQEASDYMVSYYSFDGSILSKVSKETSYNDFKAGFPKDIKVFDDGVELTNNQNIGTGMRARIGQDEYTISVTGDINGDGRINVTDLLLIRSHILRKMDLGGPYLLAADTNGDGKVNVTDLLQIRADILRKFAIEAH